MDGSVDGEEVECGVDGRVECWAGESFDKGVESGKCSIIIRRASRRVPRSVICRSDKG